MFKIKDLMIKVAPIDQNLGSPMLFCGFCTGMDTCGGCTFHTPCGGFWSGLTVTVAAQNMAAENLPLLKEQLKAQLAMVEEAEKQLVPQNLQQAEALETKLKEALDEVQQIKAKLKNER
jgi:hypothetical protein